MSVELGEAVPVLLLVVAGVVDGVCVESPVDVAVGVNVRVELGEAGRQGSATPPAESVPAGTVDSPTLLLPQQVTAPAADSAHVWEDPAATATWGPNTGGTVTPSMFLPQQATAPAAESAHVWVDPADTATWPPAAAAAGTVACP